MILHKYAVLLLDGDMLRPDTQRATVIEIRLHDD
jgi:hypothetical protein